MSQQSAKAAYNAAITRVVEVAHTHDVSDKEHRVLGFGPLTACHGSGVVLADESLLGVEEACPGYLWRHTSDYTTNEDIVHNTTYCACDGNGTVLTGGLVVRCDATPKCRVSYQWPADFPAERLKNYRSVCKCNGTGYVPAAFNLGDVLRWLRTHRMASFYEWVGTVSTEMDADPDTAAMEAVVRVEGGE